MPVGKEVVFLTVVVTSCEVGEYRRSALGQSDGWEGGTEAAAIAQLKTKLRRDSGRAGGVPQRPWSCEGLRATAWRAAGRIHRCVQRWGRG